MCPCLIYENGPPYVLRKDRKMSIVWCMDGVVWVITCVRFEVRGYRWDTMCGYAQRGQISFLVLSIFKQQETLQHCPLSKQRQSSSHHYEIIEAKFYLASRSSSDKKKDRQMDNCLCSIVINTEQRHKDKSIIFHLNHDNVVMYCSVLNDDKAIVSALRFGANVYLYTVLCFWHQDLLYHLREHILPALTPFTVCIFIYFILYN